MKLLARIVRPFYSVEHKTSQQQLLDDFGEFPPTPLSCESLKGEFEIVRIYKIGEIYQKFVRTTKLLKTMMKSDDSEMSVEMLLKTITDDSEMSAEMSNEFNAKLNRNSEFQEALREMKEQLSLMKAIFSGDDSVIFKDLDESSGVHHPIIKALLKALIKIILFGYMPIKILSIVIKSPLNPTAVGEFSGLFQNKSQVTILMGNLNKQQMSEVSIISHEHIHLLQHRNNQINYHIKSPQDLIKSPQDLLKDDFDELFYKHILYVLQRDEIEARLHEFVLSFYRVHRHLPLTTTDFLGLFSSSLSLVFGKEFPIFLHNMNVKFVEFEKYSVRDSLFAEDLKFCFFSIKTKELKYRFVTEVLTVMYGNLLNYYGDSVASENYLKEIPRPNLYDKLYK
jgi:hypothetical protein